MGQDVQAGREDPGGIAGLLQECLNALRVLSGFVTNSGKMAFGKKKSVLFSLVFDVSEV